MTAKQKILKLFILGLSLVYVNLALAQQTPPPTIPTTPPPTAAPPAEKKDETKDKSYGLRFAIAAFYNFADTPKISVSGSSSGTSVSGDMEFQSQGAPGLLFSGESRFNKSWGMEFGAGWEFERTIEGANFQSVQVTYDDPKPTMTISYFQINGRFFPADNFFILLGFNLNSVNLENSTISLDMGYGAQAGLGFEFSDHFSLEAQYQAFYVDYKESITEDSVSATADGFSLAGFKALLRFSF